MVLAPWGKIPGVGGDDRRGSGGWDTVLEAERPLEPGSEWHSELYRIAIDQFGRAAELLGLERTAAQAVAIERVADASRLRTIYP